MSTFAWGWRISVFLASGTLFCAAAAAIQADQFSDWNQASGYHQVEYRWRPLDPKRCTVEYRNLDPRDHKRYKSRIVFQLDGDEKVRPYGLISFAETEPPNDTVTDCTMITDISLTRF